MKSRLFLSTVIAVSMALCANARAANVEVRIQNFAFSPNPARVNVGDTVTWKNFDSTFHTSTSGEAGVSNGLWDSSFLGDNQSFSHTFDTPGTFNYYCIPHSSFMQG